MHSPTVDILLVEDNGGDIRLTQEALKESAIATRLHVVRDGLQAMQYLRREPPFEDAGVPDIILLDLNLPRRDGRQVLNDIKSDPRLQHIPVLVLSSSRAPQDVMEVYRMHGNCYLAKPADLLQYFAVIHSVTGFWLQTALLPPQAWHPVL